MKYLALTNSKQLAIVDNEDFNKLKQFKWKLKEDGYIISYRHNTCYRLHRVVLGNPKISQDIDHLDCDKLNNQKINLRLCSRSENLRNTRARKGSSKFKGVYKHTQNFSWIAQITINYKCIHIGSYQTEIEAAKAYNSYARVYHKKFAKLNIV